MVGGWVDMGSAVRVKLGDGVELDAFKTESVGDEFLGGNVGAVAATCEHIFTTDKAVALTREK